MGNPFNPAPVPAPQRWEYGFDANGNALATMAGTFGYPDGQGLGAVVGQQTSRSTAVTINGPTGRIVLFNATTTAGQISNFTVNNSWVNQNDTVVINRSGGSSANLYIIQAFFVNTGFFDVSVYTPNAVGTAEQPVLQFAIIKGASS